MGGHGSSLALFSLGWLELNLSVPAKRGDRPEGPKIVPNSPRSRTYGSCRVRGGTAIPERVGDAFVSPPLGRLRGCAVPHRPRRRPAPRLDAASYECHFLLNIAPAMGRLPPIAGSRRSFARTTCVQRPGPRFDARQWVCRTNPTARADLSPRGICGANKAKWG